MPLRCHVENLAAWSSAQPAKDRVLNLPEAEARHAIGSRRLSVGDDLVVFDGRGSEAKAHIVEVSRKTVRVRVADVTAHPRPVPALTLAVAMPKGPRQDEMIEKITELGTAVVQPILTERSVAQASEHKRDKWHRTAIEAAKQSGQCWVPEFRPQASLEQVLEDIAGFDVRLAAMLPEDGPAASVLACLDAIRAAGSVVAFIGPEGGWSPEETGRLRQAGTAPVSLGANVLRIETAAIAMAAVVHACATGTRKMPG